MITIGKKIKHLRNLNELNQTELAKQLGIQRYILVQIENSQVNPTADLVQKLSTVFNIDLESNQVDNALEKLIKGDANG
jgi:transcriptional regulator with XRE-family HTH domain